MSETFKVIPTARFRTLVKEVHGGVNIAAERWGVEYLSLRRFLDNQGGLNLQTVGKIIAATGMTYEELFENKEVKVAK